MCPKHAVRNFNYIVGKHCQSILFDLPACIFNLFYQYAKTSFNLQWLDRLPNLSFLTVVHFSGHDVSFLFRSSLSFLSSASQNNMNCRLYYAVLSNVVNNNFTSRSFTHLEFCNRQNWGTVSEIMQEALNSREGRRLTNHLPRKSWDGKTTNI